VNTPTHLLLSAAVFGKPARPKVNLAAIAGGLIPDLSLYAMAGHSLFVVGNSGSYVFGQQYFSEEWQNVFRIDNSFFLWGLVVLVGIAFTRPWIIALGGSATLHLATDLPLHNDDARQHFWPLTDWIFQSPISYWDSAHYGTIISILEAFLCTILVIILVRRFRSFLSRSLILACFLPQIAFFAGIMLD